jgi:hypothetical protein
LFYRYCPVTDPFDPFEKEGISCDFCACFLHSGAAADLHDGPAVAYVKDFE